MTPTSSCTQSEAQYRETEERMLKEWKPEKVEADQMRDWRIPSWLNAPEWANWMQFCREKGWMFVEDRPVIYGRGVMSAHGEQKACLRSVRACEVPGVQFFSNRNGVSGGEAPFWVCDRRAGLTAEPQGAQAVPQSGRGKAPGRP